MRLCGKYHIYSIKRRRVYIAGWRRRRLFEGGFEGGVYYYDPALRARSALIRSREIDKHGCSRQPELGHGQSRRRLHGALSVAS